MPSNLVHNEAEESAWERAKRIVRSQYKDIPEGSKRFYRLVVTIYENMRSGKKKVGKGLSWGDSKEDKPIPNAVKPAQEEDDEQKDEDQETQNAVGLVQTRDIAKAFLLPVTGVKKSLDEDEFLPLDEKDEEEGIENYRKQADYYDKRGEHKKARILRMIADQEEQHKYRIQKLEGDVDKGFWLPVLSKAAGERWITIHPHGKDYVNPETGSSDYRHVLIDDSGNIVGGSIPKEAHGKPITSWWKKQKKNEPKLHQHLREHGIPYKHNEDYTLETGHGFKTEKNKWNKDEASPGHVSVGRSKLTSKYLVLNSAFSDKDKIKQLGAKFGPQLGDDFPKQWYLPIEKLPQLLKIIPHARVSPPAIQLYEEHHGGKWEDVYEPPDPKRMEEIKRQKEEAERRKREEEQQRQKEAARKKREERAAAGIFDRTLESGSRNAVKVGYAWRDSESGKILVVTKVGRSRYIDEESAMSFGMLRPGYLTDVEAREATPEESKPVLEREEQRRKEKEEANRKKQAKAEVAKIAQEIRAKGERPPGRDNIPEGKRYIDTGNLYGGGSWFVIGDKYIWYVQNNGADGDDWSRNNVRTAGAGAIGWRIPYNEKVADAIKKQAEIIEGRSDNAVSKSVSKTALLATPAPNIIWSILRTAGYPFKVVDGIAKLPGATVEITPRGRVIITGPSAGKILALLTREMEHYKQTSEDWVDGHQTLHGDSLFLPVMGGKGHAVS